MFDYKEYEDRNKFTKHIEYKKREDISTHLSKDKKAPKKEFEYYICDYCKEKIILTDKWETQTGGVTKIPKELVKNRNIKLALHNKCLKELIKELEESKCNMK